MLAEIDEDEKGFCGLMIRYGYDKKDKSGFRSVPPVLVSQNGIAFVDKNGKVEVLEIANDIEIIAASGNYLMQIKKDGDKFEIKKPIISENAYGVPYFEDTIILLSNYHTFGYNRKTKKFDAIDVTPEIGIKMNAFLIDCMKIGKMQKQSGFTGKKHFN